MSKYGDKLKELNKTKLSFIPSSIWDTIKKDKNLFSFTNDVLATESIKKCVRDGWNTKGRGSFYSEFNPEVAKRCIEFWSDEGDLVFDPFAGRTRGLIAMQMKRNYYGCEVSQKAYIQLNKNLKKYNFKEKININLEDSEFTNLCNNSADMILTCPPYWDIEKYESCEGQLSDIKDYNLFLNKIERIIRKSKSILKENKFMIIICADFRKNKKLYLFHKDLIDICQKIGFIIHDIIILKMNTKKSYLLYPQARYHKHTLKEHEYILVFKKVLSN